MPFLQHYKIWFPCYFTSLCAVRRICSKDFEFPQKHLFCTSSTLQGDIQIFLKILKAWYEKSDFPHSRLQLKSSANRGLFISEVLV